MKRLLIVPLALAVVLTPGVAGANGPVRAVVGAAWGCDGIVTVSAEHHAISNIVIRDASGDTKIEAPFGEVDGDDTEVFEHRFASTEGLEGVFVKAGNNGTAGKANRGYGEWIALPEPQDCGVPSGDVQVSLRWGSETNRDDYDLSVTDPAGDTVAYYRASVPSGGTLDFDSGCVQTDSLEGISWPDPAPAGQYTVGVDLFWDCGDATPGEWHLTVAVGGVVVVDETGVGDSDERQGFAGPENTFTFSVG